MPYSGFIIISMVTEDSFMKCLGNRIKNARLSAGLTQEKVAELVGVSRAAISRWELGEIEPKIEHLATLSKALGISTDHLLGTEESGKKWELDISEEAFYALEKFIGEIRK